MIKNKYDINAIYWYLVENLGNLFSKYEFQAYNREVIANIENDKKSLMQFVKSKYGREIPKDFCQYEFNEETLALNVYIMSFEDYEAWNLNNRYTT